MSQRLQVLLEDTEVEEIRRTARAHHLIVAEWVRRALREARRREPERAAEDKLDAVRQAARHDFPAPDIGQRLGEIERGYAGEAAGADEMVAELET